MRQRKPINNDWKNVIIITWTYNFGTLDETCSFGLFTHCEYRKPKPTEVNFKGEGNSMLTLSNSLIQWFTGSDMFVRQILCKICQSCTYPFIISDMTITSSYFLVTCCVTICGSSDSCSLSVKEPVNKSVADFISRSGLRLLIWSRRTSPRCWHICSTHCPEGCTRDSWW